MTLVRDLLDLPKHVSKGDFVQSLAESLRDPERTVATYAVTAELAKNFREALKVIVGALQNGRSQPVFLHGSFGSGKSHFMAMLHLMLQGQPEPWRKTELHGVRDAYQPLEGKKLLQLHFHMLGAKSFESEVFGRYVRYVREHHANANLPGLFRDQEVFDNARQLRDTMGDPSFFAALNKGKATVGGFGNLGGAEAWTSERLGEAMESPDPERRRSLLTDLTRTLLPAFAKLTDRFVDVDEGLGELSRHAASLGYDGVVLYLDELILWLASRSAEPAFVQREINKLVKLKEAQDEARDIPIVAFIAEQRDLSDLVGEGAVGSDRALIHETFAHHRSRFHTIDLADSNLRAIIPHRVVVALSADDRQRLEDGFEDMWRTAKKAAATLQAGTANRDDFRQVYPFSPALIDALVALSDRLQRDRTAIRILVEMLVEHLPDLELGEVVPVGDVFDLVASADDAVDGPSKVAFQRARDLYLDDILPRLQARHGADTPEVCQRLLPGHMLRIGCSGCPVSKCRNENRLVKTLLLAALVPKAQPFDGLTVKRLVHLNHGAVKAPVEQMAINVAATNLRSLARDIHPIRIGDDADPTVSVSLQSVDLKPILQRADDQDTRQRRRYVLRKLLWEQLGLGVHDNIVSHTVEYRHTRRAGRVRFGNVRTMRVEDLKCPDDADWHVVIDYPFDEEGYTPHDDERKLDEIRNQLAGNPTSTLVWLPTFFSKQLEDDLGDLARLDHILDAHNLRGFLSHVPPDEHQRARIDLESLRDRKRAEIREGLKKAYGLARIIDNDPHVDRNRDVQDHVQSLDDTIDARTPRGAGLADGLEDLAHQILQARHPNHPNFHASPTPGRLRTVRELLERLLDEPSGMLHASKSERDDLQKIAEPLYLCRVYEQQVESLSKQYDTIEAARAQQGVEDPTLGQVRHWLDPDNRMGLGEQVANLVAWLWAHKHRRVAMDGRSAANWPPNARLSEHVVFTKPDLPTEEVWGRALERATLMGVTQGKALSARNAAQLAQSLRTQAGNANVKASLKLPAALAGRLSEYADGVASHRHGTARAVVELLAALGVSNDRALLEGLASADLSGTSHQAVARSLHRATEVLRVLEGPSWTVLSLLRGKLTDDRYRARARSILDRVTEVLVDDELNRALQSTLNSLVEEAQQLLQGGAKSSAGWQTTWTGRRDAVPAADALEALDSLRAELAAHINDNEGRVRIEIVLETKDPTS